MDDRIEPNILTNKISDVTGFHVLPFFIVALIWGSTDVLIARASIQSKQDFSPTDFSPVKLIKFILSKKIWIWMGINQIGSVLYAYLLGIYPEEYSLIWANCLTVFVSFILETIVNFSKSNKTQDKTHLKSQKMNENQKEIKTLKPRIGRLQIENLIGMLFIIIGIYLMLI